MTTVNVDLKFEGTASVDVPDHLSAQDGKALAETLALAQVLATFENPDCGECLMDACEELVGRGVLSVTEKDFDDAKATNICGSWSINKRLVILKGDDDEGDGAYKIGAVLVPDDKCDAFEDYLRGMHAELIEIAQSEGYDDESLLRALIADGYEVVDPPHEIVL